MKIAECPLFEGAILAIESSCDETSAAVFANGTIVANIVSSQIDLHQTTGGVVPEVASRAHVESILPVIEDALDQAQITFADIQAVAVTNRPGLIGALSVGVTAAKALAFRLGVPLIGIHHLEAHVFSPLGTQPRHSTLGFPHICLLVSGGHTELILVKGIGLYDVIGQTRDDAAGEAFDKTARLLGLPYPGGKALSDLAATSTNDRIRLPRGLEGDETYDFSFSGLKTAVRRVVEANTFERAVLAASIEDAIVEPLVNRAMRAVDELGVSAVTLAGGVAANRKLREKLEIECSRRNVAFVPAPLELCTDNAAMIAIVAAFRFGAGEKSGFDLECYATADLPTAVGVSN